MAPKRAIERPNYAVEHPNLHGKKVKRAFLHTNFTAFSCRIFVPKVAYFALFRSERFIFRYPSAPCRNLLLTNVNCLCRAVACILVVMERAERAYTFRIMRNVAYNCDFLTGVGNAL